MGRTLERHVTVTPWRLAPRHALEQHKDSDAQSREVEEGSHLWSP